MRLDREPFQGRIANPDCQHAFHGKVYSWSADTKTYTLLMETAPTQVTMSGSTMYFVMGAAQAVYKLLLQ